MKAEGSELLEEIYNKITENVDFTAMDKFEALLRKTITRAVIHDHDPKPHISNVSFKLADLLVGLNTFASSKGKAHTLRLGTETFLTITHALQYELDETEAFLMFHLRSLGRFRKREADLLQELTKLWQQYPEYEMTKHEFSRALKELMRSKFIEYRRGNLHLTQSFIIRYKED